MKTIVFSISALVVVVSCADPADLPPPYEEGLAPALADRETAANGALRPIEPEPTEEPIEGQPDPEPEPEPEPDPQPDPGPVVTDPPADCPEVRVVNTGGDNLNVRAGPSTAGDPLGQLSAGEVVDVLGVVEDGQPINGVTRWYEIDDGSISGFVSGAFTSCVDPNAPAPQFPEDAFLLPLACGSRVRVTQGNNTNFSHNGGSRYAFDFGLPLDTPMYAMRAGTVISVRLPTEPGDPCYDGGDSSCINEANSVTIDHGDGSNTLYAHINSATVSVGQDVERGDLVARSGSTGYSTGPHAHVQRQEDCGIWWCQSIAMEFADVEGDGVPVSGDYVTSQNCP